MGDVTFTTLDEWGEVVETRVLKRAVIERCPLHILSPDHYKADGGCLCFDKTEQERIKQERSERRAKTLAVIKRQGR